MKTIITFLLSIIYCTGLLAQCKTIVNHKYIIYIDVTDKEHLGSLQEFMPIEYRKILEKVEAAEAFQSCHALDVQVIPINDLGDNRGVRIGFSAISPNMTEIQIRKQVVMKIAEDLKTAIKKVVASGNDHYNYSRIYEPICHQLDRMQGLKQPLTIIIFSDMLEHNNVSFYVGGRGLNAEKIISKLAKNSHCSISDDLSFLSIHFISFRSSKNDRNISSAIKFWIEFFKTRNARTHFGSSLN